MLSDDPKVPTPKKDREGGVYFVLGGIILVILAARVAYAVVAYHDWTCAFANCAKVEVIK